MRVNHHCGENVIKRNLKKKREIKMDAIYDALTFFVCFVIGSCIFTGSLLVFLYLITSYEN